LIKTSESESKQGFISELVKLFALDNAKFKPEKFFKASGINQEFNKGKTISKSICGLDISVPETPNLRVILRKTPILNQNAIHVVTCLLSYRLNMLNRMVPILCAFKKITIKYEK
jgi:hypothetical protein